MTSTHNESAEQSQPKMGKTNEKITDGPKTVPTMKEQIRRGMVVRDDNIPLPGIPMKLADDE